MEPIYFLVFLRASGPPWCKGFVFGRGALLLLLSSNQSMLLAITHHQTPATDLGFLLHKNPSRVHTLDLSFGKAHVFYPEASDDCCTVALLLDVDPVGLVRNRRGPPGDSAGRTGKK